jgi:hypothetical protein
MSKRHQINWRFVLVFPAIFLIIVSIGFIYGLTRLNVPSSALPADLTVSSVPSDEESAASTAPTVAEYRDAAVRALQPFLGVVSENEEATTVSADQAARLKVEDSVQAMLSLTVPASEREFHLSAVLLMEQWKRALSGSSLDARRAIASAEDWLEDNYWLTP